MVAQDLMAGPVVCVHQHDTAARIRAVLSSTTHNGFPVVNGHGRLVGLILRSQLSVLLHGEARSHPHFVPFPGQPDCLLMVYTSTWTHAPHRPPWPGLLCPFHLNLTVPRTIGHSNILWNIMQDLVAWSFYPMPQICSGPCSPGTTTLRPAPTRE